MPCSVLPALPNAFKKCLVLFLGLPQKPAPVLLAEQAQHFHGKGTWQGSEGGLFSRAVFQPLLKTWRFSGTGCESVYNLLPFSGLFFGVRAKGVKKITKWLHLDEPHSN